MYKQSIITNYKLLLCVNMWEAPSILTSRMFFFHNSIFRRAFGVVIDKQWNYYKWNWMNKVFNIELCSSNAFGTGSCISTDLIFHALYLSNCFLVGNMNSSEQRTANGTKTFIYSLSFATVTSYRNTVQVHAHLEMEKDLRKINLIFIRLHFTSLHYMSHNVPTPL